VSSAIVGVLALALAHIIAQGFEAQRAIQQRQAATLFQLRMVSLLADRNLCRLNFQNFPTGASDPDNLTRIYSSRGPDVVAFEEGGEYEDRFLRLAGLRLRNFRPYSTAGDNRFRGTMELEMNLQPVGKAIGSVNMVRTVMLMVELKGYPPSPTAPAEEIKSCSAVGGDQNNLWTLNSDGTIYYSGFNVGIGTPTPTQMLEVKGRVLAKLYFHSSDERLKKEIETSPGLDLVTKLSGVHFKWRESGEGAFGVIAQNVESVMPEAVTTNPHTSIKAVSYDQLIGPLIESVKELAAENRELERQVRELEKRHAEKNRVQ
jgi:hypothetical protein